MGVSVEDVLDVTQGDQEMASRVEIAYRAASRAGVENIRLHVGILVDASGSMRDEYHDGQVECAIWRSLAFAASVDADGRAQAAFFSRGAERAKYQVDLNNYPTWFGLNQPALHGATDLGAGMKLMLHIAGEELGLVNEMSELLEHPGDFKSPKKHGGIFRHKKKKRENSDSSSLSSSSDIKKKCRVISSKVPFFAIVLTDGEPTDVRLAKELLRASSHAPIFWSFLYVSNDAGGEKFLKSLDDLEGRLTDNSNASFFPRMSAMSNEMFDDALLKDYKRWLGAATKKGIIIPSYV